MSSEYLINTSLESISGLYGFEFCVIDMSKIGERELNLLSILSENEINHLDSLKIEKNRIQWISGRYAVKSALFKFKMRSSSLMDPSWIDVLKGADSAPYIPQYPDLCVSITHSFPYCIGIVSNVRSGIDIENLTELKDSLIKHFYSAGEKKILEGLGTEEISKQAMIYWTRKEAVSKFMKLGMQMDFKSLDTSNDRMILDKYNICLKSFVCGEFCMSLAIEGK